MANGYKRQFTLSDIFNNKDLADKFPLVNYKQRDDDKYRTKMNTIVALVRNTAKTAAAPFYKPLKVDRSGNTIDVSGTLIGDYDEAYESIYHALVAQKSMMKYTINNGDMIRAALVEGKKTELRGGEEPKLWLRIGSMQQIKNMSEAAISGLMDDIMQNIFYNSDFTKTQNRFKVQDIKIDKIPDYAHGVERWRRKVGVREWDKYEQD